jgi:hypothetical protein
MILTIDVSKLGIRRSELHIVVVGGSADARPARRPAHRQITVRSRTVRSSCQSRTNLSGVAKAFLIAAFSFQGSDSVSGMILARNAFEGGYPMF